MINEKKEDNRCFDPTPLNEQLRNMAILDLDRFISYIGEDNLFVAKVGLLRKKNLSQSQIAIKMGESIYKIKRACKKCNLSALD